MKALVTGGAGFIGSHLCDDLISQGYNIVCVDDLSTGKIENIKHLLDNPNFKFIESDINSVDFSDYSFDIVYHLACVVGVKRTLDNPLSVLNSFNHTKKLIDYCVKSGVKNFVFTSSSEVYGDCKVACKEGNDTISNLPYATIKRMGEMYALNNKDSMNIFVFRFFNVYGPRQNNEFVVSLFIKNALGKNTLSVIGDGTQTRSFCYITDIIDMIQTMIKLKKTGLYNVGNPDEINIITLAKKINNYIGNDLISYIPKRSYEYQRRIPDVSKILEITGKSKFINLDNGLKYTIDWYNHKI